MHDSIVLEFLSGSVQADCIKAGGAFIQEKHKGE